MKKSHILGATALASILFFADLSYAFAQTSQTAVSPAEEETAAADELIVVTGSRIARPEFEGVIPGAQVSAEDIQSRGFTSIIEALNDIPLVGPGASPIGNAGGQAASLGASFVDLLDLGTNRTLTLVNGRRFVSGNSGTLFVAGNTTGGQVDLNSIPAELVARADVLTVGGAVAYGSDAIAGVVNVVLKDDFKGISTIARSGISSRGDLFNYQLGAVAGKSFFDDRANIAVSFQYNRDDGLQGDRRKDFAPNFVGPTFFGNGGVRNRSFAPAIPIDVTGANNGAFLRATDDGAPGNRFFPLLAGGSILLSDTGNVFQFIGALPAGTTAGSFSAIVGGVQAGALSSVAGNTQIVPGVGVSATPAATLGGNAPAIGNPATLPANTFVRFAPANLPAGVTAQQVINALAPGFMAPAGTTAAQLSTLAINLLQANRPTPREFLANNPGTSINAFLGSFVNAFLDVPNTDAATRDFLPRIASTLQFNAAGQLVPFVPGRFDAATPATVGGVPGGDFLNQQRNTVLRTQQDRYIGNVIGHFDITDSLRFYSENLVARVENVGLRNGASSNSISLGGTENALIVANLNNPFLTDAQRTLLIASGVATTGANANLFAISRTNQDITGDNRSFTTSTTYRTVNGLKGDFGLFNRKFNFDASFTYGEVRSKIGQTNIRDVEYALALDAVRDANGNIVCRVQTPGASTALPLGITNSTLVRERGPDGVLVERFVPRVVTPAQISGCAPLNPFGNQASQAAKNYVTFNGVARNRSEQIFGQASISTSSLFELPGGGVGFAVNGELRRETLDFRPTDEQRLGVSRLAASAATRGAVDSIEASAEARIPIVGGDFTLPGIKLLEFSPGVRFVKQDGNAPDVRRVSGILETNESKGDVETLYTLAGTWKPIDDILFRGNYTRSIRQPSVVELFLGNQPAFNTPTDPCGIAQIASGGFAANRRANCEQEVVRLGIAPDRASAANFLSTFVPAGQALQGGFAGSPNLLPEKGKSYTVGTVLTPRFIPRLVLSADYIDVEVRNQIIPTTLSNAAQFCFDSPTFNDTSSTLGGINTCTFFSREPNAAGGTPQFNIQNGFASGFINLGALKVRSVNASLNYNFELASILGGANKGKFSIRANVYRLIDYISSAAGDFSDSQNSAGGFFRPKWETQLTGRYENESFFTSWTWNWQDKTRLFNGNTGAFATLENQDIIDFPAFGVHDASVGFTVNEDFTLQFTARNIFDNQYAGIRGLANTAGTVGVSGQIDLQGRRFQATARLKF